MFDTQENFDGYNKKMQYKMLDVHEKLDYLDTGMQYKIYNRKGTKKQQYLEFNNPYVYGTVQYDANTDIFIVNGVCKSAENKKIYYWASSPIFRNYSYSGSGLPYPNHVMAYDMTTNRGIVQLNDGHFRFTLVHPSEYYVNQGKTLLKPHFHLKLIGQDKIMTVVLSDYLPNRSLKNLPNYPNRTVGR